MYSPETSARIAELRAKDELTLSDMQEVIRLLREGRSAASATTRRKVARAEIQDADTLLGELEGL